MEASALPASVGLARARLGLGASLLRLRSDEQLVSLFRAGNEDAFRVIHDRYRARILAYARQMLASSPADAEDAVQEIFVRAYAGLRANRRDLALRAWLYRIAHNRCVDDLRRPHPIAVEAVEELGEAAGWVGGDIHARVEQREALRRLIADVRRLPEQQRSALLMRELGGMPYADLAGALGTSVPAVKSLLVRARVGLVQASEARDIGCDAIREDLIVAHDRGVRASGRSRRHLRDCPECRRFRTEVQGTSRRLGLLLPALGPIAALAKLVGVGGLSGGGGAAAGSGTTAAAGSGAAAAGTTGAATGTAGAAAGTAGAAGAAAGTAGAAAGTAGAASVGASTGALASAGAAASAGHVATILAATAIAAGGAIGIQHEVSGHAPNRIHRATALAALPMAPAPPAARASSPRSSSTAGQSQAATRDAGVNAAAASATGTAHAAEHVTGRSPSAVVSGASGVMTTTSTSTIADPTVTTAPTDTTSTTGTSTATTTSTNTSTTGATGTITDPTTGTSPTPISGSGTQTEPTTSTSTSPSSRGNPGTATGIVPTVSSATAGTGSRAISRRIRLRAWRDAPRELPAGSADAP